MMKWLKNLMLLSEADHYTKVGAIEKKITDHDHSKKYNTTQEWNRLTSDNFAKRLKKKI